jgi:hypothetical protein
LVLLKKGAPEDDYFFLLRPIRGRSAIQGVFKWRNKFGTLYGAWSNKIDRVECYLRGRGVESLECYRRGEPPKPGPFRECASDTRPTHTNI